MVDWKHGRIKEVARVFHERNGINNITYETHPNSVIFLSNGFFVATYNYKKRRYKIND